MAVKVLGSEHSISPQLFENLKAHFGGEEKLAAAFVDSQKELVAQCDGDYDSVFDILTFSYAVVADLQAYERKNDYVH